MTILRIRTISRAVWSLTTFVLMGGLAGCIESNITTPAANTQRGVIVFSSDRLDRNFEIYRMGADGSGLTRLTTDLDHNDTHPVLSHDGAHIAWERELADSNGVTAVELWVMNADGSDAHAVVANGAFNTSPSWTPDDASLVFASDLSGNWEVYRASLDGSAPVNLTNSPFADQEPRVSPDGQFVLFQSNRDRNFEIYVMRIDGSDVRDVTNDAADDRFAAWAPDGAHIVWSRYVDSWDLWSANADGTNAHAVLASPYDELQPSVSPDGSAIVFQSDRGPPSSLYVVPMSGGTPVRITNGGGSDEDADWGTS